MTISKSLYEKLQENNFDHILVFLSFFDTLLGTVETKMCKEYAIIFVNHFLSAFFNQLTKYDNSIFLDG